MIPPPPEFQRLFVALELPAEVRAALRGWAASLRLDALRVLAEENLHITLAFLGRTPSAAIPAIERAIAALDTAPIALAPLAAIWLPPRRPGVLAVELDDVVADRPAGRVSGRPDPGAGDVVADRPAGRASGRPDPSVALQAALSARLVALGAYEPEARPWLPHVTVARVRRGAKVDRRAELPPLELEPFAATAVTLYVSRLHPHGAHYTSLFRHAIGAVP